MKRHSNGRCDTCDTLGDVTQELSVPGLHATENVSSLSRMGKGVCAGGKRREKEWLWPLWDSEMGWVRRGRSGGSRGCVHERLRRPLGTESSKEGVRVQRQLNTMCGIGIFQHARLPKTMVILLLLSLLPFPRSLLLDKVSYIPGWC